MCLNKKLVNLLNHIKSFNYLYHYLKFFFYLVNYFLLMFEERIIKDI